ncbi:MFS transporter [Azospirillum sp. HJ39]|uniref:MFS transporter n=1 Tax=Azospirillum sp. HJ39 TaxID=3159496 RepID=UPI0035582FAE
MAPLSRSRLPQAILLVSMLLVSAGQSILFATLPPAGRAIGLSDWQIGLIISLSSVAFIAASPVWGRLSDSRGRRGMIVLGLTGYALFTGLFAWVLDLGMAGTLTPLASLLALVAVRVGFGTTVAAAMPAAQAHIVDITPPERRTAGLARLSAAYGLGTVAGPLFAAAFAGLGLVFPLYAAAGAAALAAVAVLGGLRHAPHRSAAAAMLKPNDPRLRLWLGIALGYFLVVAMVLQSLGFVVQDRLHLAPSETGRSVGVCLLASGLTAVAVQFLLSRLRVERPGRLLLAGLPAGIAGLCALCVSSRLPLFILGMVGIGGAMGLCMPGLSAAASLAMEDHEQGAAAGLIGAAQAGGFMLGPLVGASLYQLGGSLPFLSGIVILAALFALCLHRLRDGSAQHGQPVIAKQATAGGET